MKKSQPKSLLEEAIKEIDEEDTTRQKEELKEYLKRGLWNRVVHPAYKKGMFAGAFGATIIFIMLIFLFGPIFCKG